MTVIIKCDICMFYIVWKNSLIYGIIKVYEKRSLLSFNLFLGISPCWVASNISKLFMILLMHSGLIKSKVKTLMESLFSRITFILEWFWYFTMAFLIVRPSISRFWTMFPKDLLKMFTNSFSSKTTLLIFN